MALSFESIRNFFLGSATGTLDANFSKIASEFRNLVYRDGSNVMSGNLDMDGRRIINHGVPRDDGDLATIAQVRDFTSRIISGPPGPSNNTRLLLENLKAAAISDGTSLYNGALWTWTPGDFSATPAAELDVSVVKANAVALSVGAWVRSTASGLTFKQPGAAPRRNAEDRMRESVSVLDYLYPTDADHTLAFTRALGTGKRVFVPKLAGGYRVNNIPITGNVDIYGEKAGECLGPEIIGTTAGGALFVQSPTNEKLIPHIRMRNMVWRAADGVLGVTGFRGLDKTDYSGYALFEDIESHRSLALSYDSNFIFATWRKCRDGYLPGIGTFTAPHGFIRSDVATVGQGNSTNTNWVEDCAVFRSSGVDGAIQLSQGDTWTLTNVRFENMSGTPLVRARGVRKLVLNQCRAEGVITTGLTLQALAGIGTTCIVRDGLFAVDTPNFTMASVDSLSTVGFYDCEWSIVGAGARLVDLPGALTANHNNVVAGTTQANALAFMAGMSPDVRRGGRRLLDGAVDNGVASVTLQNAGAISAAAGFLSRASIAVSTEFVTIATSLTMLGGECVVSGFDAAGGGQLRFHKSWQGTNVQEILPNPNNNTGKTVEFRVVGDNLQMRVSAGTVMVFTTMVH